MLCDNPQVCAIRMLVFVDLVYKVCAIRILVFVDTSVRHPYVLIGKCGFLLPTSRDLNVIIGWIIWSIQKFTIKTVSLML